MLIALAMMSAPANTSPRAIFAPKKISTACSLRKPACMSFLRVRRGRLRGIGSDADPRDPPHAIEHLVAGRRHERANAHERRQDSDERKGRPEENDRIHQYDTCANERIQRRPTPHRKTPTAKM